MDCPLQIDSICTSEANPIGRCYIKRRLSTVDFQVRDDQSDYLKQSIYILVPKT